jgi:sulfur-oxidizing protein SoxY
MSRTACIGQALSFLLLLIILAVAASRTAARADEAGAQAGEDVWPDLQTAIFADREIADGSGFMHLEAPMRAADAAVVPLEIKFDPARMAGMTVKTITLVIDKNPAPVAAVFHLAVAMTDPSIGTRIRVNEYTNIHAVAEMSDGRLYMAKVFVKAAGGCSAPAVKTPADATAHLGEMKLKLAGQSEAGDAKAGSSIQRAQLLIRHPNFSGMQMDQVTRYYIPAKFIEAVDITYAGQPLMTIEGNISLSENPFFDFAIEPQQKGDLSVTARDSDGAIYKKTWPVPAAS